MKCLSVVSSFTVKTFKENTLVYIVQTLYIFHLYVAFSLLLFSIYFIIFTPLIYDSLLLSLSQVHAHLSDTVTHLEIFFIWICLCCVSVIIFWPGASSFLFVCLFSYVGMTRTNSTALPVGSTPSNMWEGKVCSPPLWAVLTIPSPRMQQVYVDI